MSTAVSGMIKDINEGISIPEVWYSVTRFATKEWGKQLYPPNSFLHQEFVDIGFYEGLSTGMPGAENINGYYFNKSLAPYGCWFHFLIGSNIYLKLDRIIPKDLMDNIWDGMKGNGGCLQHKRGIFCGDKYKCTTVLNNNYDTVLGIHNIENIEIAYCNDQCAKVGFNTSCPPIELRTGYRGTSICNCSINNNYLNCDNNIKQHNNKNANHYQTMHLHQHQLSKESIHVYKCIINNINDFVRNTYLHFKKTLNNNFEITIYFTSELIAHQNSIQRKIFNYKLLDYDKNMLLINMEASSLTYYGYVHNHNNNLSNHHNNQNYMDDYNNDVRKEKVRVINFNSKRGPWDQPRYRYTSVHYGNTLYQYNAYNDEIDTLPVYMNVIGFENPTILHIGKVAVGLICYVMILLERKILDFSDLIYWIIKEIKCLQAKRVDLIGLIGQGNNMDDDSIYYKIYEHIKDYIHFNLIVNNNNNNNDITALNHNILRTFNQSIISFISSGNVQVLEIKKYNEGKYSFKSMLL